MNPVYYGELLDKVHHDTLVLSTALGQLHLITELEEILIGMDLAPAKESVSKIRDHLVADVGELLTYIETITNEVS